MTVTVDGAPYLPEPFAPGWRRESFPAILDTLAARYRTPLRVQVREADGSTFTDIITPPRERPTTRPWERPAPETLTPPVTAVPPVLHQVAGAGFVPGEDVAVAIIHAHSDASLDGTARALLTAERTALNFVQLLSGTATLTSTFVQAVAGTKAKIVDTRKTLPGLRLAQKYAVRVGGGTNHRIGLYDGILIKENHIIAAGSIKAVIEQARSFAPSNVFIEVEVENLVQLEEALAAGAKMILLDNMKLDEMRRAVEITAGRAELEASGGVNLERVRAIAETGVDRISIGSLTKDVRAIDLSLRHVEEE